MAVLARFIRQAKRFPFAFVDVATNFYCLTMKIFCSPENNKRVKKIKETNRNIYFRYRSVIVLKITIEPINFSVEIFYLDEFSNQYMINSLMYPLKLYNLKVVVLKKEQKIIKAVFVEKKNNDSLFMTLVTLYYQIYRFCYFSLHYRLKFLILAFTLCSTFFMCKTMDAFESY